MGLWDIEKIPYVGREKGPQEGLAFHYYDADKVVAGKKMKDWLRFGVAWWHTFDQELVDPFGTGTAQRPWYGKYSNAEDEALAKVDYAFEFFQKLGVEYFCFHDRDIAPEGDTLRETDKNLDKVVDKIEENMKSTGIKLLWNTSSLFTNPRFVSGASTSPFADIYAYAGGQLKHSLEIAKRLGPQGRLIAIDKDPDAVAIAGERLREFPQATVVQNDFANIPLVLDELGIDRVDGILLDLGVSSHQLDTAERGFSYNFDAPLDMRMSQSGLSAYDIVNTYSVEDITRILREFSEEKFAYRIAQNIEKARQQKPVETTFELVEIIKQSIPAAARREGGHPAKRTFQALRIAVNQELDHLSICLDDAFERLAPGGRFAVITFHSLEDRMVKQKFAALAKGCICPPDFPVCVCGHKPRAKLVNRKPIEATAEELAANKRSHSAKLRVCERLPEGEEQQG